MDCATCSLPVSRTNPLSRRFPKLLICPFILGRGRGGRGGRPSLIDRPGARLGNFLLLLGGRWEASFREPEAKNLGMLVGGSCWAAPISASLFPTSSPQHGSKVVRLWNLGIFLWTRFFVLSPPESRRKSAFRLQWWAFTSRSSGRGSEPVGWQSGVLVAGACRHGSKLRGCSWLPIHLSLPST